MKLPWMVVMAMLALGACSKKQDDAPTAKAEPAATATKADEKSAAGADPWQDKGGAAAGGGAPSTGDTDDTDDTDVAGDPDDGGEAVPTAAGAGDTAIDRVCARDAKCGCPIEDCPQFFAKVGLPESVIECFVAQSCEDLCAKNSGAPGSALYKTCMAGKVPTGDTGGAARKRCRQTQECGAQSECCGGLCYQMGTSLWITACQMPSGKF